MCGSWMVTELAGPSRVWIYIRCLNCQHAWLDPSPTEDFLRQYYNSAYEVNEHAHNQSVRRELPAVIAALRRRHSRAGRLLEVGCSYGAMLAALRADGWDVEGVELDQRASDIARLRYGITVHPSLSAVSPDPQFDVVILFHVLEHVLEPRAFLRDVRLRLRPGGTLLLRTPNAASVPARISGGWWQWFAAPEHVHVFSPESCRLMLGETGYKVDRLCTRRGDAYPLAFELLRASVKRLVARRRDEQAPVARNTGLAIHQRWWYQALRRIFDAVSWPLEQLLEVAYRLGEGGPELLVAAVSLAVDGPHTGPGRDTLRAHEQAVTLRRSF